MGERRFLLTVCGGGSLLVVGLVAILVVYHVRTQKEVANKLQTLRSHVDSAIASSNGPLNQNRWDESLKIVHDEQEYLNRSMLASRLKDCSDQLHRQEDNIKAAKALYNRRVSQGWSVFEGRFIPPEEKASVLRQREKEVAERLAAEKERRRQEELDRQRAERESAERERRAAAERAEQERRAIEAKAKEMYGSYKKAAEVLADNLLKVISATEAGITYVKYGEMLQELQFSLNKFQMRCSAEEKNHPSYLALTLAVDSVNNANRLWKLKIEFPDVSRETRAKAEEGIQESWKTAAKGYQTAMEALSQNK